MRGANASRLPQSLRRRNILTGIALSLLPATLLVRVGANGMEWSLWRDARPIALLIVAVAAVIGLIAWRTRPQ
jgi:hypothetical protein